MRALVIGGAGATGIVIVGGLLERDFAVTVLNRGYHATDFGDRVETLVADPHDADALAAALDGRDFDLAIATYGALKKVVTTLEGKTPRLISVGGVAPIYKGWGAMTSINPWETTSPTPLFLDEHHALSTDEGIDRFAASVRRAERFVIEAHEAGKFNATHFRYPLVYGPANICPAEWGIIRRVREGRRSLILPGGGQTLVARGYSENMAHAILLAVEQPEASAGEVYNLCDAETSYNLEWLQTLEDITGHAFEHVDIPFSWLPEGFRATPPQLLYRHHGVLDIRKLQRQLGYRDVVPMAEALERTVQWYSDHPLTPGDEAERNLGDPFDYEYEDALIAAYRRHEGAFAAETADLPRKEVAFRHPYQKP